MAKETNKPDKAGRFLKVTKESSKGSVKGSVYKTLAMAGLGYVAGSLGSVLLGKASLYTGLGLTFLGNYQDNGWMTPVGIGMMASSHMVPADGTPGSGFGSEDVKQRLSTAKDSALRNTFLNKVLPSGNAAKPGADTGGEETSGFGSVQQHLNTLKQIDQQLMSSAMAFESQRGGTSGVLDEFQGFSDTDFSGF